MSLYSENSVWSFCGLRPAFLHMSREVRKKKPEIFRSTAHSQQRPTWAVTEHPAVGEVVSEPFPGSGGIIQLPAHHAFLLACSSRYWRSCVLLLSGPNPRKAAACIALRASKPLCTAERLRKSLGTSASPPQVYPPHCSR